MTDEIVIIPSYTDDDCFKGLQCKRDSRSWDFTNANKEAIKGKENFIVCSVKDGAGSRKLMATIAGLTKTTRNGITSMAGSRTSWIDVELTPAESESIIKNFDDKLKKHIFDNRRTLCAGTELAQSEDISEWKTSFHGLMKKGKVKVKKDSTGKELPVDPEAPIERWSDSVHLTVPMKNGANKQKMVDPAKCRIIDDDGKPYAWAMLQDKKFEEIIVELEKITVKNTELKTHWTARCLNVQGKSEPIYTGKRKITQVETSTPAPAVSAPAAAAAPAPAPASDKVEEPAAKKQALPGRK